MGWILWVVEAVGTLQGVLSCSTLGCLLCRLLWGPLFWLSAYGDPGVDLGEIRPQLYPVFFRPSGCWFHRLCLAWGLVRRKGVERKNLTYVREGGRRLARNVLAEGGGLWSADAIGRMTVHPGLWKMQTRASPAVWSHYVLFFSPVRGWRQWERLERMVTLVLGLYACPLWVPSPRCSSSDFHARHVSLSLFFLIYFLHGASC